MQFFPRVAGSDHMQMHYAQSHFLDVCVPVDVIEIDALKKIRSIHSSCEPCHRIRLKIQLFRIMSPFIFIILHNEQ